MTVLSEAVLSAAADTSTGEALATSIVPAAVGALLALAGVWLKAVLDRRNRERQAVDERRNSGAELAGDVLLLLDDANPVVVSVTFGKQTDAYVLGLRARWDTTRESLVRYAAAHPAPAIAEAEMELRDTVWNSLMSLSWATHTMTVGMLPTFRDDVEPGPGMQLEMARHDHHEALKLAEAFLALVRRDGKPRGTNVVLRRWRLRRRRSLARAVSTSARSTA